ncbi:hypothetical protein B0H12DRAFT_388935 [Mycena haematopus]|nr:hypothetical protein B0H12DRAFT_388935 [Mycena haematopus]
MRAFRIASPQTLSIGVAHTSVCSPLPTDTRNRSLLGQPHRSVLFENLISCLFLSFFFLSLVRSVGVLGPASLALARGHSLSTL